MRFLWRSYGNDQPVHPESPDEFTIPPGVEQPAVRCSRYVPIHFERFNRTEKFSLGGKCFLDKEKSSKYTHARCRADHSKTTKLLLNHRVNQDSNSG